MLRILRILCRLLGFAAGLLAGVAIGLIVIAEAVMSFFREKWDGSASDAMAECLSVPVMWLMDPPFGRRK